MAAAQSYPVVVIDSDKNSLDHIVECIKKLGNSAEVVGFANDFEKGLELIQKERPKVVIMEIDDNKELGMERINGILNRFPFVSVFATCDDKSSDSILSVMRAGADEYILRPVTDEDLASALAKHGRLWLTKTAPEKQTGKIFTLFSPKGGVGVTTLSINLATHINESTRKSTLIVDLDLNAGDITTFLNIKPAYTISDVTVNMSRLDKSFLKGVITRHDSGVYILAEPQRVEEAVNVVGKDIRKVLEMLASMFDYIIIDTETTMDERTQTAIEMADLVLLVFVMSLPGIKNMQRYLYYLEGKGISKNKIKLMVNRYIKKGDIRLEDAEKALNYPIFWSIPNDYDAAISCLNKGVPLSECAPRSKVNSSITDLSRELIKMQRKER